MPKFNPDDFVICVSKDDPRHDISEGFAYRVVSTHIHEGVEYIEVEQNDSGEPHTYWKAEHFVPELDYLNSLKVDDEVIEVGTSGMTGKIGVVYESTQGRGLCIKWEDTMCTSITHGARRLDDVRKMKTPRGECWMTGPWNFRPTDRSKGFHISENLNFFE